MKSDEETLNRFYICTRIVTQGHSKQLKTIQYSNKGKSLLIVYFLHMKTTRASLYWISLGVFISASTAIHTD